MLALTLHRPWPWAIFWAPRSIAKRIENRPWKPWARVHGQRIAVHAGKHFDSAGADRILDVVNALRPAGTPPRWAGEGIIGTARVAGWLELRPEGRLGQWRSTRFVQGQADVVFETSIFPLPDQQRWWSGPYAWFLEEVRALAEPIPCRGRQGFWTVPTDVERRIVEAQAA